MTQKKTPKDMKPLELGPTGFAVADAVRKYRQNNDYTYAQLEQRLTEIGHRIPVLGLRRIEAAARRVDMDDFIALAAALNVPPLSLVANVPADAPTPDYQMATGLPDDVGPREFQAWVRGETDMSLKGRVEYWKREIQRIERVLERDQQEIARLREELTQHPGDPDLLDRLHWAEGREVDGDKGYAEAQKLLEDLRERLKDEEYD
ncbi:helix-turn-helix domain-containing protein [Brevibacterium aurantiacum]|uniref:XRE family transcriptional regulator n=1 Tax=Brevibacterium aurantiacum TaxID=273384 RepID=A0A2H1KYX2_BREAU|nr:helix-turn-helix transcriptional regulator [Brevibacterium aurantiacum]TGD38194.1 XRE family transcriptional regulator [Brevibacterium aurantiacum]SMY04975.1 hypothetical protein BAURA86_03898 [Brevibacterium aurantiacum]